MYVLKLRRVGKAIEDGAFTSVKAFFMMAIGPQERGCAV